MITIYDDLDFNKSCLLCGVKWNHSKRFLLNEKGNDLKIVDIVTHCPMCRSLLKRMHKIKGELNQLETDYEYLLFMKDY